MSIDIHSYELALFSTKVTNRKVTKKGYRVGEFLIVSYSDNRVIEPTFRIFRIDGLECIRTTFIKVEDAIQFAEWLSEKYGDFFFLWTEYPNAELFRWTYLTIPDGEKYWKALEQIDEMRKTTWEKVYALLC